MHLQSIVLPAIVVLLPAVLYTIYCRSIESNRRRKILISGITFLIIGIVVPWIATIISAHGLYKELPAIWIPARSGSDYSCEFFEKIMIGRKDYVSKAVYFFYAGYLINAAGIPLLGCFFYEPVRKSSTFLLKEPFFLNVL